jgi:hypothetical protein
LNDEFIVTRWIYDDRILSFILEQAEVIDSFDDPQYTVLPAVHEICSLLNAFSGLVETTGGLPMRSSRKHTGDCGRQWIPSKRVAKACSSGEPRTGDATSRKVREWYILDSTYDLLPLAFRLTPSRRKEASNDLWRDQRH